LSVASHEDEAARLGAALWSSVDVIAHETQKNKTDRELGVESLLPMVYKRGLKRLPRKQGDLNALNFVRVFTEELTTYLFSRTDDCVMADWFGEFNMKRVLQAWKTHAQTRDNVIYTDPRWRPPPYLDRQRMRVAIDAKTGDCESISPSASAFGVPIDCRIPRTSSRWKEETVSVTPRQRALNSRASVSV